MERGLPVISIQSRNFCANSLLEFVSKLLVSKRPVTGESLSRVKESLAYLSYHGQANFSHISLQNFANSFHERQKVGSDRGVNCLAFVRVTLPPGPILLHINTLAHLGGSPRLRTDNQSMREHCYKLLACTKKSPFFRYKRLLKLTRLGG